MGLESALWEATRPAFRVRYIHDPASTPRVPLYASYGVANKQTFTSLCGILVYNST